MSDVMAKHYARAAVKMQRWHKKENGISHFLSCMHALKEMHKNWSNWPKKSRRHEVIYWLEVW